MKKTLIICISPHHGNTMKVAKAIAEELDAEIKDPSQVNLDDLHKYDLIGFGSGIYDDKHHLSLLKLVDTFPEEKNKKVFLFSTSGIPVSILGSKFMYDYLPKAHSALKEKLESKGYKVLGDFISAGFNTNVFLKYFGGVNKKRPNEEDLGKAKGFARKIKDI